MWYTLLSNEICERRRTEEMLLLIGKWHWMWISLSLSPLVYVFFLIEVMSSCDVGVPRESSTLSVFRFGSKRGTQVYLGLENSASCGGYLRNYTICYYNRKTEEPVTSGQLSMWETGTTSNGLRFYNKVWAYDSNCDFEWWDHILLCVIDKELNSLLQLLGLINLL